MIYLTSYSSLAMVASGNNEAGLRRWDGKLGELDCVGLVGNNAAGCCGITEIWLRSSAGRYSSRWSVFCFMEQQSL